MLVQKVENSPDKQISETDPDARLMKKKNNETQVCYNVQSVVDTKHHLIIAHEVFSIQDSQHLYGDDWQRTVYIDSLGVKTTDFDLSDSRKKDLIISGHEAAEKYLKWWSDTSNDLAVNHPSSLD